VTSPLSVAADLLDPPELKISPYKSDPVRWVHDKTGDFVWSVQREILESVRDNRRTAVPGAHKFGKTFIAGRIICWWIDSHPLGTAKVLSTSRRGQQLKSTLWKEVGRVHTAANLPGRLNQTEWWVETRKGAKEELVAFGAKPADDDPSALHGHHERFVLVLIDEACYIPDPLWDALDPYLANPDSRIACFGNPDDPHTRFQQVCKPGSGWNVIQIGFDRTPNFTEEKVPENLQSMLISPVWVEEKKRSWGETNPLYISKVLGQFPDTSEGGLIPISWVRAAQDRSLPSSQPVELGVDVGGGGDANVICLRRGPVARVIKEDHVPDTMQTLGNVMAALSDTRATTAKIDNIGIGAGAYDRAREIARDESKLPTIRNRAKLVKAVDVRKSAASDPERFQNIRAEMFWELRDRFEEGSIDIDPNDEDLAAQLVEIRFGRGSQGRIKMESKEDMQRRGVGSPNRADALALAMYAGGKRRKIKLVW
jgi:hypothetical protein